MFPAPRNPYLSPNVMHFLSLWRQISVLCYDFIWVAPLSLSCCFHVFVEPFCNTPWCFQKKNIFHCHRLWRGVWTSIAFNSHTETYQVWSRDCVRAVYCFNINADRKWDLLWEKYTGHTTYMLVLIKGFHCPQCFSSSTSMIFSSSLRPCTKEGVKCWISWT